MIIKIILFQLLILQQKIDDEKYYKKIFILNRINTKIKN